MGVARADRHRTVAGYLAILRPPNLFTAPPDVLLGAVLAGWAGEPMPAVAAACLASVALYAGGTTLNDYVDAEEDAAERPERPIPSGAVPRRHALVLGLGLLAAGVVVAALAGPATAGVALGVALAVGTYNRVAKGTPAGPPVMGLVRALNVLLGVVAVAPTAVRRPAVVVVPAVVLCYVAAVTHMGEAETAVGDRTAVVVGIVGSLVLATAAVTIALAQAGTTPALIVALGLSAGFVTVVGPALRRAYADPRPGTVGPAVGRCVVGLVLVDGAVTAALEPLAGLLIASALLPAVGLARVFDVS